MRGRYDCFIVIRASRVRAGVMARHHWRLQPPWSVCAHGGSVYVYIFLIPPLVQEHLKVCYNKNGIAHFELYPCATVNSYICLNKI